jgi:hypothetical protein
MAAGGVRSRWQRDQAIDERCDMTRVIDCPCGHQLEAEDDEALVVLAREHMDRDHREMVRADEQIRARIAADAVDAPVVAQ